jgi:hypothetical protein
METSVVSTPVPEKSSTTAQTTIQTTAEPTSEPASQESSTINHVIMSVVHVTKDWMLFNDISGWTGAILNKEEQGVKFYEATIWDDGLSVHLYALPNDYNPLYGDLENYSTAKKVEYRESFCIKKFSGMPFNISDRGPFLINVFTEFAKTLIEKHPNASHNLIFTGHGGLVPGGELFGLNLNYTQANTFLSNWHSMLGRKLGFIDMGGPCKKGSFHALEAFHEHTNYYIASDLDSGCSNFDNWTMEVYNRSDTLYNYPRLLSSYNNMRDALIARVNLTRLRYEDSTKHINADKIMQSCYLYSCSEFSKYKDDISSFIQSQEFEDGEYMVDILKVMKDNEATQELMNSYKSTILHGVDTKDFFTWPQEWNGMLYSPMFNMEYTIE